MAAPRFHFVDLAPTATATDVQFWRDVEASERLTSRFKANLFLRELCHARAWAGAASSGSVDHFAREEREHALLREVAARGYRLFGSDLAPAAAQALARTG